MKICDFLTAATAAKDELSALRRGFHRLPEMGNREKFTSDTICAYLSALGITVTRPFGTAVVGVLNGKKAGKTVALRSDMDALPIIEQTELFFASQNAGCMHACGHDLHMAAQLYAAKLLANKKDTLCGTVKFIFEPDEEGNGGAKRLIEAGCLTCPKVDAIFGLHASPELPVASVGIRFGKFYAASNPFTVTFHGKSAHAAEPQKGKDALYAAAKAAVLLKELTTDENEPTVVTVGTINAGTACNILADTAVLSGIIRTLGREKRTEAVQQVTAICEKVATQTATTVQIDITDGYAGITNHDGSAEFVRQTALKLLPEESVKVLEQPTMTTEDFGVFLEQTDGAFYHVGVGIGEPLHSPHFCPDEAALPIMAAMQAALCYSYLMKD